MRWLRDDRGATVVVVAVMMTALLAMVGFAVDAGALYQEKRELTNGADAAALAVAEDCALGTRPCEPVTAAATAAAYADANSRDGASSIVDLSLDPAGRSVTVVTGTENPDGTTKVRPFFTRVVGWEGATVKASATAIWGYPNTVWTRLPLTISECEFPRGTVVPTPPRVYYFHDGGNAEECNAVVGMDTNGDGKLSAGFGWLMTSGECSKLRTAKRWSPADPGSSPTSGCSVDEVLDLVGKEIPLPVFDDVSGLGSGGQYHLAGFGLFHITGFNFGGLYKAPTAATAPCQGDERCVSGYFTSGVVYDGEPGGENRGFVIVKLTD